MHFTLKERKDYIQVRLIDVGNSANSFLKEFHSCRSGECTCNPEHFEALESMEIQKTGSRLILNLYPRDGTSLEISQLKTLLDHSIEKTEQI
jgi:hypothetical protein